MTNEYKLKGDVLVNEANSLIDSDVDSALKLLDKAQINYILAKAHIKTGEVCVLVGDLYSSKKEMYLAASNYNKAGESYIKVGDYTNAKIYMDKAYDLYLEEGQYTSAGKITAMIAEFLVKQNLIAEAVDYYNRAYDYYLMGNSEITGAYYLRKAGYLMLLSDSSSDILSSDNSSYYKAINCLKIVFDHYSTKELTMLSNSEILLDIGIIYIYLKEFDKCHEWLDACINNGLGKSMSFTWLKDFVDAIENEDMVQFSSLITNPIPKNLNMYISKCFDKIKQITF
jgi:tetratricopeptide (TPR) repeat protein